jgi:heme/copper-type cytochrome/quinol oxidase subunit 2
MEKMSGWEMLLMGAVVLLVLLWIGPGIKPLMEQSRRAESRDWAGLLLPIALVILFVLFLIMLV